MDKFMNVAQVRKLLKDQIKEAGSQWEWARQHKISRPHVNMVLHGHRLPGFKMLKELGLVQVTYYYKR